MINKKFFLILFLFFVFVESSFALETYIGIQINNLTDDPAHSCVGEPGYPASGRIQAISSILPTYPLYFSLSYVSNGSIIWSGNSIFDQDYEIGDTIYVPQAFNLSSGESYKIMMDIDAIRIFLPMTNANGFTKTGDNNYWTAGYVGTGSDYEYQTQSSNCAFTINQLYGNPTLLFFSSKNRAVLSSSCYSVDYITYNCLPAGFIGIAGGQFRIDGLYNNMYLSNVGNVDFYFTY